MVRSILLAIVVLGLAFLLHPSTASANATGICDAVSDNYVLNCGFELGTYSSTIGGNTNPNVPIDWTPNAAFDLVPAFNHVTSSNVNNGNSALSIGNYDYQPLATLSQTITDELGGTYIGSFYAFDGGAGGDPAAFLTLTVNGGSPLVSLNDTASSYAQYTFTFTSTGSDTLTFSAQTNPSEWFVDDVAVTGGVVSVTPEPISILLFGTGLLAVAFVTRRKIAHPTGC